MGKLSVKLKTLYGLGLASRGIKDGLFQIFLFFYFSQVLGLDAKLAGTSSLIALLFDAISDPLVGVWSDRWQSSKWGRRHPFMFFSALPLGLFTWILFMPPEGLDQSGLFLWLTIFSILVRIALTFFQVPHMSLGAELTHDYDERTSVTSYALMFAALLSPLVLIFGILSFFQPTADIANGMLNASAYPKFALLCGFCMMVAILVSVWGTKSVIPSLPRWNPKENNKSIFHQLGQFRSALKMRSYLMLVGSTMLTYIGLGIGIVFSPYLITYYFGMSEKEIAVLPIASALGGIFSLFLAPYLSKRIDKKWSILICTIVFAVFFSLPFNLRIIGFFPNNGASNLLIYYVLSLIVAYTFLWISMSMANSMMADVTDEYELRSGNREEGLFFATMSFAYKLTTGAGYFIAGFLLDWISFPKQAKIGEVGQDAIDGLGLIGGPILLFIYLSAIFFIYFYPITHEKYLEIRTKLDQTKQIA